MAPSRAEIVAHLARILDSREFRAARNRARFLEFVVTRTLDGGDDSLKEYTIGVEVFDRGAAFDPRTDGVVRTQAGLVRKHLERYYATEGRDEPVEIVLPKGHYIPQFQRRAVADPAVTTATTEDGRADDRESDDTAPRRGWRSRWTMMAAGAMAAAAIVAVAVTILFARSAPATTPAQISAKSSSEGGALGPVWDAFLQPGASNVLAFGIPQFFTAGGGLWIRDTTVNSASVESGDGKLQSLRRQIGTLQPAEAYTGIGEAYGVYLLSRFFLGRTHELRVVRSPTVSWENLKHDNVIFLTSARFKTLANQLSYPSEFVHVLGQPNRVSNLHPAPGEQAEYWTSGSQSDTIDHAIISLYPGKLPGRRVLILSGGHTWGTQGAAEYVTEAGYLRELNAHLLACQRRQGLARHPDFFQVLLRVEVRDNQPIGVKYLTHRDLALSETGEPTAPPSPASTATARR